MPAPIRVAVVGVGHLGRFHAQKYAALPDCELVAVVDADPARAKAVGEEVGAPASTDLAAVLQQVDAVSIATPTQSHQAVGLECLRAGKHALIEKPLAATLPEGEALVAEAQRQGVALQVGYVQRFNPAFVACRPHIARPRFIESIRIQPYTGGRGADVDVVLDLMSHDLDLVASLVDSPLHSLHAVGISLVTTSTDLAHAHLVFENGCTANLTASRISVKAERRMRLFQRDRYFSIDFVVPSARQYVATPGAENGAPVREEALQLANADALQAELAAFLHAVRTGGTPPVTGADGLRSMELADRVMRDIARNVLP
ncbi:MAG TPA: Gfo/Idh/MocA family oxidoreductase [bacterium]|nr:Gfo/Idh/MocA family oxidoreductase [bacterium]